MGAPSFRYFQGEAAGKLHAYGGISAHWSMPDAFHVQLKVYALVVVGCSPWEILTAQLKKRYLLWDV